MQLGGEKKSPWMVLHAPSPVLLRDIACTKIIIIIIIIIVIGATRAKPSSSQGYCSHQGAFLSGGVTVPMRANEGPNVGAQGPAATFAAGAVRGADGRMICCIGPAKEALGSSNIETSSSEDDCSNKRSKTGRGSSRPCAAISSFRHPTSHVFGYTSLQSLISSLKKACRFTDARVPRCSGNSLISVLMRSIAKSQ